MRRSEGMKIWDTCFEKQKLMGLNTGCLKPNDIVHQFLFRLAVSESMYIYLSKNF